MTAPNIVNVAGIKGVSSIANFLLTSANTIVENPVSSNNVIKLNSVVISNINVSSNSDATVVFNRSGTPYHICKTITVPAKASLVVVAKETSLYLEEGDSITAYASTNGDLSVSTSYEIISEQSISAGSISIENDLTITDPYFANVSLLLHGDGTNGSTTITDSSSENQTLTAFGNLQINTSIKKYGTGSIKFDGTGDYALDTSPTNMSLGAGDFTVEYWVYPTTVSSAQYIIDTRSGATGRWAIYFGVISGGVWELYTGSSTLTSTVIPTINTWQHVAWCRSSGTLRLFVNGVQGWSTSSSETCSADYINLGRRYSNAEFFNGYLDDFRVTPGVARYTSGFTPPTEAFPDA